jgi:hypothetical protein
MPVDFILFYLSIYVKNKFVFFSILRKHQNGSAHVEYIAKFCAGRARIDQRAFPRQVGCVAGARDLAAPTLAPSRLRLRPPAQSGKVPLH